MRTLLITGFTTFGPYQYNSSQQILSVFQDKIINDWLIETAEIPTSFEKSFPVLKTTYEKLSPDAVISFGMNAGSDYIKIETRARNLMAVKQTSPNVSPKYLRKIIDREDPSFRKTVVPVLGMASGLKRYSIPFRFSFNAGLYVCNYLYFTFLSYLCKIGRSDLPFLFIHIPAFPGDAKQTRKTAKGMTFSRLFYCCHLLLEDFLAIIER